MNFQKAVAVNGDEFILKVYGSIVSVVPKDQANTDYQDYLAWLAAGNEPEVIEA